MMEETSGVYGVLPKYEISQPNQYINTDKIYYNNIQVEGKQEEKNELLEQIFFIASQRALPKDKQNKSIVKAIMLNIKKSVFTIGALYKLWEKVKPFFDN
ncbi:MAG: hypothetical protein MI740_11140 [Halanaerobiales bacterium]|nr:hypothetical protein [Halanaerobiales bacterium]